MLEPSTSLQRILTALGHREPDRVPLILCAGLHGAKELGLSIPDYFSSAQNVVEGQLRLRAKYRSDSASAFFFASAEMDAWGGETIYSLDGPPNAGAPVIRKADDIAALEPPQVCDCALLRRVLEATEGLKSKLGDSCLLIGVVISPFSLPVMQMGFDRYIELIYEQPDLFGRLMKINEQFCVQWANAQFAAGATAMVYFDPVSSTTIVPRDISVHTGLAIAKRTIAQFKGPAVIHFASGRCLSILEEAKQTGAVAVGVSALEDMGELKAKCAGKVTLLGNLNAIEMRHWTPSQTESKVKEAIAKAGRGGGFLLSDNHGEIPWQVPEEVLMAISDAIDRWGRYPLSWVNHEND